MFEIDKASFTLANNESKSVNVDYRFDSGFNRAKIQVVITKNLIGTPEFKRKLWWPDPNYPYTVDIHFWIDEIIPTTITIVKD